MKRVLHIVPYYPPCMGGIEDVCYNIVTWLSTQEGVEQRVFCFNDERRSVTESYEGVDVVRVGHIGKISRQCIAPRYLGKLRREMRRRRPDVVHFHAPNPLAAACLLMVLPAGVKLIVHWHADIVEQKNIYRLIKPVETALLRRADVVVATSERYIDGSRPLAPFRGKCMVIPCSVNTAKMDCDRERVDEIRRHYDNKPLLLFMGRHVTYKGLDHLLGAVGMLRNDCHVVVGGMGPLTGRLESDYRAENIHFVGRIPDDDLSAYCHAADVFLFPSITKNEAFGVALAQAMYCHTPAVTFTIAGSGVNWVNLDGVTGIEVENGNTAKLAEAIDRLVEDDELRREYGANAHRRVVDHMTFEKIAPLLGVLYGK